MTFVLPLLEWWTIAPAIALTLTGCAVLVLDLLRGERADRAVLAWATVLGVVIAGSISASEFGIAPTSAFSGMVIADNFTQFFTVLFLIIVLAAVAMSFEQFEREEFHPGESYSLLAFSGVGMVIMASAADFVMVFIGVELLSICLYVLAGFSRKRLEAEEAAIKYLLLGAFASAFLLYGIALVYGSTGSTNLACIGQALGGPSAGPCNGVVSSGGASTGMLLVGLGMLIVGLGFKAALVPFHAWAPDVYEGAPTAITAFMSVGVKAAAFATVVRVFLVAFPTFAPDWSLVLAGVAAVTMIVGNVAAIAQTNIKRLLGYSSIAHAGYILVAVVAGSRLGVTSLLFYTVGYTVMNLGAFAVVMLVGRSGDDRVAIRDYAGLSRRHPYLAGVMALFLLSLAGIPPTVGFVGKFYIFSAAVEAGHAWLALVGLLTSVVSVYYYLGIVCQMYMVDPATEVVFSEPHPALSVIAMIAAIAVVVLGIAPSGMFELATASTTFVK